MEDRATMRLSLVLERDSDPIRGSLQSLDGEPQQFEGWTVAHWVRARDEAGGGLPVSVRPRPQPVRATITASSL